MRFDLKNIAISRNWYSETVFESYVLLIEIAIKNNLSPYNQRLLTDIIFKLLKITPMFLKNLVSDQAAFALIFVV